MSEESELKDGIASSVGGGPKDTPDAPRRNDSWNDAFEWLDGPRFVIWRWHYDHPKIPDAITIIGVTDEQLSMHYYDQRGVYRVYATSLDQAEWRYWRDAPAPDFSQRFTGTFSDDGNTITGRGQLSKDGSALEDVFALDYQRVA